MSDPVVSALLRAWDETAVIDERGYTINPYKTAKAAAREVAKLIREIHRPEPYAQGSDYCVGCEAKWPCVTAELVWSSEELASSEELVP